MNQREATDAIIRRFVARWPIEAPGVPYSVDNVVVSLGDQAALPRVALNIISFDSTQRTLGERARVVREGLIDVRIYERVGVGRGTPDDLVSAVRRVFERRRIGPGGGPVPSPTRRVVCYTTSANELRRDKEAGGLWVVSATTDFEFTEIRGREG